MPLSPMMRRLSLLPLVALLNKLSIDGIVVALAISFIKLFILFVFLLAEIILSECFQGLKELVTKGC